MSREVKYISQFKNNNEEDIYVSISYKDDATEDETREFKVTYNEPIIITQNGKTIYEPLKTQGCTIRMFSNDIHWDLYTPNPTGIHVRVWNWEGTDLFNGYLTPCIYSQDYAYNGIIELEAVDYLAVLASKKYTTIEDDYKGIYTADRIIRHIIFDNIPAYSDETWNNTDKFESVLEEVTLDDIKLQESNFFDDDGEPMTCKEVLEEICKYLGASMGMYDDKIWIWDYDNCALSDSPTTLLTKKYGKGTPSVELDDVYSKISISCDMYEIEDLVDDIIDDENTYLQNILKVQQNNYTNINQVYSDYAWSFRKWKSHTKDENKNIIWVKHYILDNNSRWKPHYYDIDTLTTTGTITEITPYTGKTIQDTVADKSVWFTKECNYLFNPKTTGAFPLRMFNYTQDKELNFIKSIDWEDYIVFPSYGAIMDTTDVNKTSHCNIPALTFKSGDNLAYSIDGGTGYITFNAELCYQANIAIDSGPDNQAKQIFYATNSTGTEFPVTYSFPFPDLSIPNFEDAYTMKYEYIPYTDENKDKPYWTGVKLLVCKLRIGDKYWNGSSWTTTDSTFEIGYHDDDVDGEEDVTCSMFKWIKPVANYTVPKYMIGEDGYSIPITANDKLSGELEFTINIPKQFYNLDDSSEIAKYSQTTLKEKLSPNIFMKDLKLKYKFVPENSVIDDVIVDDDIIYENVINENYSSEFDDLTLKINSWYNHKPISKSYALDTDNKPIKTLTHNKVDESGTEDVVQEAWLLQKYYNHYKTPKKILNLNYKLNDYPPFIKLKHTYTNTTYSVISYENDVKAGEINFKMVEL